MTAIPSPTVADRQLDLAAAYAIAEAATPAPWQRRDREIGHGAGKYHADTEIQGNPVIWHGKQVGATPVCRLVSGFVWFEGDCAFIPLARTALPAAIRRAAAAEAEAERLRAELARLRQIVNELPPED